MSDQQPTRIGSRISELRKIHGATQRAPSMRANMSYSLLCTVERGERPTSYSFVAAVAEWNHSLILLFDGAHPAGLRSIDRASTLIDLAPAQPGRAAVRGALHLRAAILSTRTGNTVLTESHLSEARALVAPGQEQVNYYGTKFGKSNVDIHRVAVPVELADGTTAVSRADAVRLPSGTAPSRSGHYWIDLSRAWLLHGDRRQALDSLHTARRIASQLTRYHPQVHETVQTLTASGARSTDSLSRFAAWCGIRN